jgi:hypothetical protein
VTAAPTSHTASTTTTIAAQIRLSFTS